MRPAATLAAYALVLALAFGAGAALGTVVGPIDTGDDPAPTVHGTDTGHPTSGHGD